MHFPAGPYKLNGVPLRRVNRAYVLLTKTVFDLGTINVEKYDDVFFTRPKVKEGVDKVGFLLCALQTFSVLNLSYTNHCFVFFLRRRKRLIRTSLSRRTSTAQFSLNFPLFSASTSAPRSHSPAAFART